MRNPRSVWFLYFIVTPEAIKRYIIIFVFLGSTKEGEFGEKKRTGRLVLSVSVQDYSEEF